MYLANPDNPMGTWHDAGAMQEMIDNVPDGTVLCLDEAYLEFAPEGMAPALDSDNRNVIRMRTFSKAYGMAGARVGYAIGHADLINSFNKVRNHFGMNRASQAGALAALEDQQYLGQTLADVGAAKARIGEIVRRYGLEPVPSATNFRDDRLWTRRGLRPRACRRIDCAKHICANAFRCSARSVYSCFRGPPARY